MAGANVLCKNSFWYLLTEKKVEAAPTKQDLLGVSFHNI